MAVEVMRISPTARMIGVGDVVWALGEPATARSLGWAMAVGAIALLAKRCWGRRETGQIWNWACASWPDLLALLLVALCVARMPAPWATGEAVVADVVLRGLDETTHPSVLVGGIFVYAIFGELLALVARRERLIGAALLLLLLFLAGTSLLDTATPQVFKYRGEVRACGIWSNPNTFGPLMAVGLMLAAVLLIWQRRSAWPGLKVARIAGATAIAVAAVLCFRGLLLSYSRGAWLAALVGLCVVGKFGFPGVWKRLVGISLCCAGSLACLSFCWLQGIDIPIARRVLSLNNPYDVSRVNRLEGWRDAAELTLANPIIGTGWGKMASVYLADNPKATAEDVQVFHVNDLLVLGATLGMLALAAFCGLVTASARGPAGLPEAAARGVAAALLCSFWFDGGLFRCATAFTFWGMLAWAMPFRSTEPREPSATAPRLDRTIRIWRIAAAILLAMALASAAGLWTVRGLALNSRNTLIAQTLLASEKEAVALSFLSNQFAGQDVRIGPLLDYARHAEYVRDFVAWRYPEGVYLKWILLPEGGPPTPDHVRRARSLWLSEFDVVRGKRTPSDVVEALRKRMPEIKEAELVEVLRIFGVASRLDDRGILCVHDGHSW